MSDAEPAGRPFPDPEHSLTPRKPRTLGGAVYLLVLIVTGAGLALVLLDEWRSGLSVVGGAMVAGGVGRLVISDQNAGMLGLRRKLVDVATLVLLGAALLVLAAVIPDRPL
jgi:multisubunit Na+/H+ antiporter MnhB subunit